MGNCAQPIFDIFNTHAFARIGHIFDLVHVHVVWCCTVYGYTAHGEACFNLHVKYVIEMRGTTILRCVPWYHCIHVLFFPET